MDISLYSASVPIFAHYLRRLIDTVDIAERHECSTGTPLLTAALADGMFPYAQQVTVACGFTVRACCPLLGIEAPALPGGDQGWAQLRERIAATLDFLERVPRERIDAAGEVDVSTVAGLATRSFKGRDFVLAYALPNFFFHVVSGYAILRSQGVPIGKQDFDGYHAYPDGFRF